MYYVKEIKPRTYYINVFLKDLSFLLAFHNGYYDKLVIVSTPFYVGKEPMKDVIGRAALTAALRKVDETA